MKIFKPSHILIVGSVSISIITLLSLFLIDLFISDISWWIYIIVFLTCFISCYTIFSVFIRKYISNRLSILYRTIRKGKSSFTEDDAITKAEKDTHDWTLEKQKEINRLQEQAKFRREFLGNLAHELKTPIFSIQGYLLTLLEGGLDDQNVNKKFLERASKATDRMVNLIEDLDQIMKLEVNELPLEITIFNIKELVKEIFESLEDAARNKNITLKFHKQYDPIFVKADRAKISQVLTNLIKNSIAYGNVNGQTSVHFYELDEIVTIEVSDNGPGIDDSSITRIFERFYRIEKSRNRNEGGSGLGLSIVKHIIEAHQQTIQVHSTIDVGTTFVFTLDADY